MSDKPRQVFALGGGGIGHREDDDLVAHILESTGKPFPKICYIPTATADPAAAVLWFKRYMFRFPCVPSNLELFAPVADDLDAHARELLLKQDAIYVEGGNTANMLAIWRVHGIDDVLREAYQKGVVMFGKSAGSLCWFEGGTTDSFGRRLREIKDGLGIIKGSNCPHYDAEPERRPLYLDLVQRGILPPGRAADDGVALHYINEGFVEALTSRKKPVMSYEVTLDEEGRVREIPCEPQRVRERELFDEREILDEREWMEIPWHRPEKRR